MILPASMLHLAGRSTPSSWLFSACWIPLLKRHNLYHHLSRNIHPSATMTLPAVMLHLANCTPPQAHCKRWFWASVTRIHQLH
jgi:hypothetical protein